MRLLSALRWTINLNKSLVSFASLEQKSGVNLVFRRAINSRHDACCSVNAATNLSRPRRDSTACCKQTNRSFSVTNDALAKSKDREKKKSGKSQHINLNELAEFVDVEQLKSDFERAVEDLKCNFVKHLTLRSSIGSIEQLTVTFEGQDYLLQELVDIARKPKIVVLNVNVFPQAIPQVLEALNKSGMNLNPQQDGTTIFIPIPKVTREHRETLSKNAKSLYIKCRDNIKDIRNKEIKNLKKKPSISEDSARRIQSQVETLCDQYISEAEKVLDTKQKDLLGSES